LAETIIAKISKELENPKVLQQILQQSVADVESKQPPDLITLLPLTNMTRGCSIKGTIDNLQLRLGVSCT
jgi:F-type H+-transporting ATPase subunit b